MAANTPPVVPPPNETRSKIALIGAVTSPLAFFTLVVLIAEAALFAGRFGATSDERKWLVMGMIGLIYLSVIIVAGMAVFRKGSLLGGANDRPLLPPQPQTPDAEANDRPKILHEDDPPPPPGVWYTEIRPVLHQAIHYTVPTYYLDTHLRMIDWNIAFDLVFSRLGSTLRDTHVTHFIRQLQNAKQVMDHAVEFTQKVLDNDIPFIDVEPIVYASENYGVVSFLKIAAQLHATDGSPRGWSVSLIIREIEDGKALVKDLLEVARKDKLWAVYSASYDRVLLEFDPYKQLIRDVIGVVPPGRRSVIDLGAGTGNTTKELLAAGYAVTAVENNLGMLDRLRSKRLSGELTVVKSSVESLTTLSDQSFEAAVMVNVLYAVDDPLACLQSVYRILKRNGVLALSTTHSETRLDRLLNTIKAQLVGKGLFDRLANDFQLVYDVNRNIEKDMATRHTRDEYCDWIRAAGFRIIKEVPSTYEDAVMLIWAQKN
jgi:ubiquinone/menaquinone biosynthesis C-methylase UbiE